MRGRRRLRWFGLAFLAALILAAGTVFALIGAGLPTLDGTRHLTGLHHAVTIRRDQNGIPFIQAASSHDAWFALGYVHAQDRLWQMEMQRRLASGTLAEVLGPKALPADRLMRTLGFYRAAEAGLKDLSAQTRADAQAYADGVNAWIDSHRWRLPPEFVLLRDRPKPWRVTDSTVWGRVMALYLSGDWRLELLRWRLEQILPPAQVFELLDMDPSGVRIDAQAQPAPLPGGGALTAGLDGLGRRDYASNNWVVSGKRTVSGKPLLANDPHLFYQAPILWYLARLQAPGLSLAGATIPGEPFLILGHNDRLAWGVTTTESDIQDLFIEKVDPADPARYLTPDGSAPFSIRHEVIHVRGEPDSLLVVRTTRHGPVISDLLPGRMIQHGLVLALDATFLHPNDLSFQAFRNLGLARGWTDFRNALRDLDSPQLNFVYADTGGSIAFIAPGRIPIRAKGFGAVPHPGWTGAYDWTGFIPFDRLPQTVNPADGLLASANNRIIGPDYPYFLGQMWDAPYRVERIRTLLNRKARLDMDDMARMQADIVSPMARDLLGPMLRQTPASAQDAQALALLAAWDGRMDRNRPEPLIFSAWIQGFWDAAMRAQLGPMAGDVRILRPLYLKRLLTVPGACAFAPGETCAPLLKAALDQALEKLQARYGSDITAWRWGKAHPARFANRVLGSLPGLGALANLSIAKGGGPYTLDRGTFDAADSEHPFANIHGPSLRAIYDLSDLDRSRFMIATGESGNIFSSRYRNFLKPWRDVAYVTLPREPAHPAHILTLLPMGAAR